MTNPDYSARAKSDRQEGREDARIEIERRREAHTELNEDRDYHLNVRRETFVEYKPEVIGGGSYIRDPRTGAITSPSDTYANRHTGGLTPRASFGADNADNIVDRKIGFIAASWASMQTRR
jgi:hypothetical protein